MLWYLIACMTHSPIPTSSPMVAVIDERGLVEVLHNSNGPPMIMTFWATWCGPCASELPTLNALAAHHPEVVWVLVNVVCDDAKEHFWNHEATLPS